MNTAMNKTPSLLLPALLTGGIASAELLVHENFDYPAGDLSGQDGGSGWAGAWLDTGNPILATEAGLNFTDVFGNELVTSGGAANTVDGGSATTISGRETGQHDGELWISMLIQPQNSSSQFFGVSFYQDTLVQADARFAIESVTAGAPGKDLRLTRRAPTGAANHTSSFSTTIGTPVFAVLHLVPDGGAGGELPDRIDVFFNPRLDEEPFIPHASASIGGLHFDRIRVAGQNGRASLVDEIRIGTSYAAVSPHTPPEDPDTDGDGLTDAQEAILGTDPHIPDTELIAAIRANPHWFNLHSDGEITDVKIGGITLEPANPSTLNYHLPIKSNGGTILETIDRSLGIPPEKKFLRIHLDTP